MPDCKGRSIQQLVIDLNQVISDIGELAGNEASNMLDNLISDFSGDTFKNILLGAGTSIVSDVISSISNINVQAGELSFGAAGKLLSSILTSSEQAVLGYYVLVLTLYRYELESRLVCNNYLLVEVQKLILLVDFLKNYKNKTGIDFNIQQAYDNVYYAWDSLKEANSRQRNFNQYDLNSVNLAKTYLRYAKSFLSTELADTMIDSLNNVELVFNLNFEYTNLIEKIKLPQELKEYYQNPNRKQLRKEAFEAQKRTLLEDLENSANDLLKGIGSNQSFMQAVKSISNTFKNISLHLPLNFINAVWFTSDLTKIINGENNASESSWAEQLLNATSVSKRSLKSLNTSVKSYTREISTIDESFDSFQIAGEMAAFLLEPGIDLVDTVLDSMEPYAEYPKRNIDYRGVNNKIKTYVGKEAKFYGWKKNISSALSYINSINDSFGDQVYSVNTSYKELEYVMKLIKEKQELYDNDNENSPDSEAAYNLFSNLFKDLQLDFKNKTVLNELSLRLHEIKSVLLYTINSDWQLSDSIIDFSNSVIDIPGVENAIKLFDGILNNENLNKNKTLKVIFDRIKSGDVSMLTALIFEENSSAMSLMGAIPTRAAASYLSVYSDAKDLWECTKSSWNATKARKAAKALKNSENYDEYKKNSEIYLNARAKHLNTKINEENGVETDKEGESVLPTKEEVEEDLEKVRKIVTNTEGMESISLYIERNT